MPGKSKLTEEQKRRVAELGRTGLSRHKIAAQLGLTEREVRTELTKSVPTIAIQTTVQLMQDETVRPAVKKNVFDITEGIQDCLTDIQKLLDDVSAQEDAPLKERVMNVTAKAQIYMHAATIVEKVYNAKAVEAVLQAVFAEYEQEQPDIKQRILVRLGNNALAKNLLAVLGTSGETSPNSD